MNLALSSAAGLARGLDWGRSRVLRQTLSRRWLRDVFVDRARRLGALFAAALVVNLALALFAPLWMLAVGPVLYGFPHLVAGIRYVSAPRWQWGAALSFLVFAARAGGIETPLRLEIVAAVIWVFAAKPDWRRLLPVMSIFLVAWHFPVRSAGAFLLAHGFVSFAYWIAAARNSRERRVACSCLAALAVVTLLIFLGGFDWVYRVASPGGELPFSLFGYETTARLIFSGGVDPVLGYHAVVAYALVQSIHYFVWLKAIPDQRHGHPMPTSFRQSLRLLEAEFGVAGLTSVLVLGVVASVLWFALRFQAAQTLYFQAASFHGYLELAALPFLAGARRAES